MRQKFWRAMRVTFPLALILPGWSLSQIPDFFTSSEMKLFISQVVTQLAIGVADAAIELAVMLAFGLA